MSRSVRLRPAAEADIREAYRWYEERARGLGAEFLRVVDAAFAGIARHPESFQTVYEDVRRALLRKFPYGLFYVVETDTIVVLACFHARRDPTVWQDRT